MITKEQAILTLRLILPKSKKVFYQVTGEPVGNEAALWTFRYFVAKENEIIQVTPLISLVMGYRTTDTEFMRIRGTQQLNATLDALQKGLARTLPEDGILLCDLSEAHEIVEISLLGSQGVSVPEVPELGVPELTEFDDKVAAFDHRDESHV